MGDHDWPRYREVGFPGPRIDAEGSCHPPPVEATAVCRSLKLPPCLVGMEACATSHHWSRELGALGHTVRLMPPRYVKAYVKRQKNDAADAEAICEAVSPPNMRFVETKTPEQQRCLMLHRTRHILSVSRPR